MTVGMFSRMPEPSNDPFLFDDGLDGLLDDDADLMEVLRNIPPIREYAVRQQIGLGDTDDFDLPW